MGRPKGSKNKPKVGSTPVENKVTVNNARTVKNRSTTSPTIHTPSGNKTVKEVKENLSKYEQLKEVFAATKDALQLVDLTKTDSRTFQTYNRETLRTYLKSPKSYETQLRNLSRYLYRLCYEYKRICTHYATMICGDAFNVVPLVDEREIPNDDELIANYYETLVRWQRMDIANELVKLLLVAWREDTVYAYVYDDSDQEGGSCFFHILDGDYCRVSSIEEGVLRFAFDFSYFRSHQTELEYYDQEFTTKYNAFTNDSTLKWQELDPERQICLKVNVDDPTMDYPPLASLFQKIISLIDLQELQTAKNELSAYKLLVARLQPLSGTAEPDDFEIDVATAIKYYNKLAAAVPDCVNIALSPMPIETVEFDNLNDTDDVDMISNAMNNIFKTIGGVILDTTKTGTTVYEAQIINDMEIGQATLLPQLQRWINLYLNYVIGENHAFVKYIDGVSPYTRKARRKELLESAQNGLGTIFEIGVLDGSSPQETMSKLRLQSALGLQGLMQPLQTSYTQSGAVDGTDPITGGAPTKDATDLTDEGSSSRESGKNA